MYLGHLAAGLVVKRCVPEARLSWLLLASVWLDLLCGALMVVGLEYAVVHGAFVFGHLEAHVGFSHSLTATFGWAVLGGLLAARVAGSRRIGIAVAAAVGSHFVLDVLSHLRDMPVLGFGAQPDVLLGTGLAAYPLGMFLVELAWCIGACWLYDRRNRRLLVTSLVLMALYTNTVFGFAPPPVPTPLVGGVSMLGLFLVSTALLLWAARPTAAEARAQ